MNEKQKGMVKLTVAIVLMACTMPAVCLEAAQILHSAIIISMQGEGINVQRFHQNDKNDRCVPAKAGMKLYDRDTIITPASAACIVMLDTGEILKIAANTKRTIGTRDQNFGSLPGVSRRLARAIFTADTNEDALMAVWSVRAINKEIPVLLFPAESSIATERPVFQWSRIPGTRSHNLTLLDSEGNVWTKKDVGENKLEYPSEFPVLKEGTRYFWQVDAVLKDSNKSSETGMFDLAGEGARKDAQEVRTALAKEGDALAMAFLLGIVYQRHNMMHSAIEQYQKMIECNPNAAYPCEQLGVLYAKLGWKEKAIEAFSRAAELDPELPTPHRALVRLYEVNDDKGKAQKEQVIVNKMALAAQGMTRGK